jgi:hypothetical protein
METSDRAEHAIERFPAEWHHSAGKKSAQIQKLEHILRLFNAGAISDRSNDSAETESAALLRASRSGAGALTPGQMKWQVKALFPHGVSTMRKRRRSPSNRKVLEPQSKMDCAPTSTRHLLRCESWTRKLA